MNRGTEIIEYRESQRPEVIELWRLCGLLFPGNDPDYDIDIKMRFQPGLFFVMPAASGIIATIMAGFDGHRGWLNYLCVHPDFRNRGYGTHLVSFAAEKLKALGCPKINHQIRNSNSEVINFYKKAGFNMHDVVCMQLKI